MIEVRQQGDKFAIVDSHTGIVLSDGFANEGAAKSSLKARKTLYQKALLKRLESK